MAQTTTYWFRTNFIILVTVTASAMALAEAKRPDLNGTWTNASLTGLTRPGGVDKLVVTPAEAKEMVANTAIAGISPEELAKDLAPTDPDAGAPPKGSGDFGVRGYNAFWIDPGSSLARVKGEFRTSYIVDPPNGQIPYDPEARSKGRNFGARYVTGIGGNEGPEALPLPERCLIGFGNTGGPGMQGVLYNNNYQFVQTEDHLMILVEMVHDARIIPLFDSAEEARANHKPDPIKPWLGDSVGWYEGNTLVVETINFKPIQMQQDSIKITEEGRLIERFQRYAEDEIFYQFTVEDPNLYTQLWAAELSFYATEGPVYEYACHEGNYAMEGILAGARRKERQAE